MTLEQALLKIIDLQQQIIDMKSPLKSNNLHPIPADVCIDGGFHDYPTMWHGTIPPSCGKCSKQLSPTPYTVTWTGLSYGVTK